MLVLAILLAAACGSNPANNDDTPDAVCSDGADNDADGAIDFPEDLGCVSPADDTEDSPTQPQCNDGRDNDGDGKIDFPADPGCFQSASDNETDDCPAGPNCPQCSNGRDDDMNGLTDFPDDPGCEGAGDTTEFINNPVACGSGMKIKQLPTTGMERGELDTSSTSMIMSPCGGGLGSPAVAYVFLLTAPKVIVATTDHADTTADTVLDIRSANCEDPTSEIACSDDIDNMNTASAITRSLPAGTYYLIVSGHDASSLGSYLLDVKLFSGEGATCAAITDCGPGLVCRTPLGGPQQICTKPVCSDGIDDDADGKIDYPNDPGCASPNSDAEQDNCPGAECPECANGVDDDGDGQMDYPADVTCKAASDASEACPTTEGVELIVTGATLGTTVGGTHDSVSTCGGSGATAPDKHYRLDVPATTSLTIATTNNFDATVALLDSTCGGAPIQCKDQPESLTLTNLAAGTYYFIIDGFFGTSQGTYTINVSGTIGANGACEGDLVEAGAITCIANHACQGAVGMRRCLPAACSDGLDNNGDGKKDFPNDPSCTGPGDATEETVCPGANCPACSNATDDDMDMTADFPMDFGCASASAATETFCMVDPDFGGVITTPATMGTLAGKADNYDQSCQSNTGNDAVHALQLPVPVASLQIDTIGSVVNDTVVSLHDASCGTPLGCDDDGDPASLRSLLTLTNVPAGNYAIQVDAFSTGNNGAYTLNVRGTVAPMTQGCTSPLFAAGVLACPMGTSCTNNKCQ